MIYLPLFSQMCFVIHIFFYRLVDNYCYQINVLFIFGFYISRCKPFIKFSQAWLAEIIYMTFSLQEVEFSSIVTCLINFKMQYSDSIKLCPSSYHTSCALSRISSYLPCSHLIRRTVSLYNYYIFLLRLKNPCKDMEAGLSTMRLIVDPVMVLSR